MLIGRICKNGAKKKAWSLQNCGKRTALNDTSSESHKLDNLLTQQKVLKSINN